PIRNGCWEVGDGCDEGVEHANKKIDVYVTKELVAVVKERVCLGFSSWISRDFDLEKPTMTEEQDLNLTFSGCGFLGIYHLGVVSCLKENAPALLKRVKCYGGASAGSFAAIALLLDLNVSDSAEFVIRLAKRAHSLTLGPLHPSFNVVRTLRRSFERILPENAHELASGRLHISLTRVSDLKNVIVSEFFSKEDLVEIHLDVSYSRMSASPIEYHFLYLHKTLFRHMKLHNKITIFTCGHIQNALSSLNSWWPLSILTSTFSLMTWVYFEDAVSSAEQLLPPTFPNTERNICMQAIKAGKKYPDMLKDGIVRKPSMSQYLPTSWSKSGRCHNYSSSSMSAYSTCSSGEGEVFSSSSSESDENETEIIEQEGESKLTLILHHTSEAINEAELWSCYFIRRVFWVFKLAAKPCVISLKQISHLAHIIVESLPKVEKTGNQFLDDLLAMIYMVIHTYQDKHQVHVHCWYVNCPLSNSSLFVSFIDGSGVSSAEESTPSSGYAGCPAGYPQALEAFNERSTHAIATLTSDEDSDIEVLVGSFSMSFDDATQILLERAMKLQGDIIAEGESDDGFISLVSESLGRWEDEGGACSKVLSPVDDYVVLDGYETDVDSELTMEDTQDFNLTFSGCGFLGIYHIGVMACLKENAVDFLKRVQCFGGASAGAFAAIGLVVDLDISEVTESVIRLSKRAKSFSLGPLHPSFQIVKTVRRAFEKMLPDNAHEIASGKLHISLTRVPDLQNVIVSKFFSKEDLIEALVATSFVPLYSGILPAVFRGKYYVDGGISDNLPQHFKEGETITVSPFSGESDICPRDTSSNDVHIELKNTSMQFTLHNFYRFSCALFPPNEDVMSDICRQGYRDTLRFLKEHYPDTLTKMTLRSPSTSLSLPPNKLSSSSGHCTYCGHGSSGPMGSQEGLVCSFCGNGVREQVSSPTEEVEEGESKLSRVLCDARNNALKERELWSCIVIRRSIHLVKVLSKPCVITVQQFLTMLKM
ncbi:unnamed protein product, partial [Porites evermanni]